MLEKIYSNMSACHMKNKNWQRAIECADKALAKNADNHKALFRKAKAFGEQGFFEKSSRTFEDLKKKNPSDATNIDTEIAYYRKIDQEKEKASAKKMKGFLKNKTINSADSPAPAKS
jgi:tetratricopeptide (TPR) repeat protein